MLRRVSVAAVLAAVLAACGGSRERGPAWPKPSPTETDGGESLAPRAGSSVAAAIEDADDVAPTAPPAAGAAAAGATPASAPGATPSSEAPPSREPDILTTEEIVIEIDD